MHSYIKPLEKLFKANANKELAPAMSKYMRNLFPFYGIMTPLRKQLMKEFYSEYGLPEIKDLNKVMKDLWALPQREFQYAGLSIASRTHKHWKEGMVPLFEYLIKTKSWWDTVDGIAPGLAGKYFLKFGVDEEVTDKWIESDNFWFQRSAIIFQLKFGDMTDEKLLYRYIKRRKNEDEFFIRKAIGWALRQYAYVNPESVKKFVAKNDLKPLSVKEALKHIG
jgi:3-methyladenine DNA glycosylase AlkD